MALFAIGALSPSAGAAPAEWQAGVEALTDFPLLIGGRLWGEAPHRIRMSMTLGGLPGPYVDAINGVLVAAGAYDQLTADLIRAALRQSMLFRVHAGWRPLRRRGLYFEAGYGLVALGGGLGSEEIISAVSGATPPDRAAGRSYSVASMLHMIDVEIGWQWVLWRGLTLRTAIGFAGTVAAQTSIKPDFQPRNPSGQARFTQAGEAYLDDVYTSYVFAPVVSMAVGWRWPFQKGWLGAGPPGPAGK